MTENEIKLAQHDTRLDNVEQRIEKFETMFSDLYDRFDKYLPRYVTAIGVFGGMLLGGCITVIAGLMYAAH